MQTTEPRQRTRELEQSAKIGGVFVVADGRRAVCQSWNQASLCHFAADAIERHAWRPSGCRSPGPSTDAAASAGKLWAGRCDGVGQAVAVVYSYRRGAAGACAEGRSTGDGIGISGAGGAGGSPGERYRETTEPSINHGRSWFQRLRRAGTCPPHLPSKHLKPSPK